MVRRPSRKRKRWWALGVLVLIIGAAGCGASEDSKRTASQDNSQESQSATPTPQEEQSQLTPAQEWALLAGARYRVDSEGMSKFNLIQELRAVGYSRADATFAANKVGADWKKEAVEQARGRLDAVAYPKRSLFLHLTEADGFTRAQAQYAVSKVYD